MNRFADRKFTIIAPIALLCAVAGNLLYADELAQVTVTANRPVKEVVGKTAFGANIEVISMSGTVKYADLDITSRVGATALEGRIKAAAKAECLELDKHYPLTEPNADQCAKDAVREAMPAMNAAIAAAEKKPRVK